MFDLVLKTPQEVRRDIASRAQARRLMLNISQKELAARSGVSLGSVKRFETTGDISLASLVSLSMVLNDLDVLENLFTAPRADNLFTMKEPMQRKRAGRKHHES
ncbi:MAG: helix-turn-helix domain-containing protein [Enterobacteriaceae bacterium]